MFLDIGMQVGHAQSLAGVQLRLFHICNWRQSCYLVKQETKKLLLDKALRLSFKVCT